METFTTSFFWVTLAQIMMINIVLSGDNAVVIALASRSLPPSQQKKAIFFGSFGAIVLRVILTFFAVLLLGLPYLKIVGAALLGWIGIKMLLPDDGEEEVDASTQLWAAIKTIIVADFIMSLDNVLGVAAAAKGSLLLLVIGLAISIPIIIYGSTLVLKLMTRWPIIITVGGGVLGWVAGEMAVTDPVVQPWVDGHAHWLHQFAPALGAAIVVIAGRAHTLYTLEAARAVEEMRRIPAPPAGYRWSMPLFASNLDGTRARDTDPYARVAVPIGSRVPHRGRWRALFESWKAQKARPT
jgi:YjbE family integral membrane protein